MYIKAGSDHISHLTSPLHWNNTLRKGLTTYKETASEKVRFYSDSRECCVLDSISSQSIFHSMFLLYLYDLFQIEAANMNENVSYEDFEVYYEETGFNQKFVRRYFKVRKIMEIPMIS